MLKRNRDVLIPMGVAALVSALLLVALMPLPPHVPSFDPVERADPRYQPGGSNCRSGPPIADAAEAAREMDRCIEEAEQYRLRRIDLFQQTREANAAEAQAILTYDMAWMVLVGTIGGIFTLFAAAAAALYARDAARAAKASLSHSTEASEAELRPWLELEIVPVQFRVNDKYASARFAVRLKNLGKLPAVGVFTDGQIFNSASDTDDIPQYFASGFVPPAGRMPRTILPQGEIELEGIVSRKREQILVTEAGGEAQVHTVLAVRAVYEWRDGGKGRTCQSYAMFRRRTETEERSRPIPLNTNGEIRRQFEVKQTRFDNIL